MSYWDQICYQADPTAGVEGGVPQSTKEVSITDFRKLVRACAEN